MMKVIKSCSFKDLEMFIDLIEAKNNKVYSDYKELAEVISRDFEVLVTEEEVWDYYDNYYCISARDKEIHNNSLGIIY